MAFTTGSDDPFTKAKTAARAEILEMMKRLREQREKLYRMRRSLLMAAKKHREMAATRLKEIEKQSDLAARLGMAKGELERIKKEVTQATGYTRTYEKLFPEPSKLCREHYERYLDSERWACIRVRRPKVSCGPLPIQHTNAGFLTCAASEPTRVDSGSDGR